MTSQIELIKTHVRTWGHRSVLFGVSVVRHGFCAPTCVLITRSRAIEGKRPAHPSPFSAGGDPGRAGRGSMAESRIGLCLPTAVAETRPSVGRGERGRDEAATQVRGRTTRLSVPTIRQIAGGDRHTTADRGAQRYGRARWQCLRFAIRPFVALTQGVRVHLQTDDRRRAACSCAWGSAGVKAAAGSTTVSRDSLQCTSRC
jgi:hypothetical protein